MSRAIIAHGAQLLPAVFLRVEVMLPVLGLSV